MSRIKPAYCEQCGGKRLYRTEIQARDGLGGLLRTREIASRDASMHPYRCPFHNRGWHIGHDYKVAKIIQEHESKKDRPPCPE